MLQSYKETIAAIVLYGLKNGRIGPHRWSPVFYVLLCLAWPGYGLADDQPLPIECDFEKAGEIHLSSADEADRITAHLSGRNCLNKSVSLSITRHDGKRIFQRFIPVRNLGPETSGLSKEGLERLLEEMVGGDVVELPDLGEFDPSTEYNLFVSKRWYEELRKMKTRAYAIHFHFERISFIYYVSKKETVYEIMEVGL